MLIFLASIDITQHTSEDVREETAELASQALSDIASNRTGQSPSRRRASSPHRTLEAHLNNNHSHRNSNESTRREIIPEVSEPSTPHDETVSAHSHSISALAELLRQSLLAEESPHDTEDEEALRSSGVQPVTVREGIISQPHERTSLLLKKAAYCSDSSPKYGSVQDLENQQTTFEILGNRIRGLYVRSKRQAVYAVRRIENSEKWDGRQIFQKVVKRPASYIPPVILGLLLNILDALSYGTTVSVSYLWSMIAYNTRNDSVSFRRAYVRAPGTRRHFNVLRQLYSIAIGLFSRWKYLQGRHWLRDGMSFPKVQLRVLAYHPQIEVVPFFHKMAFTILNRVGEENPKAVLATTILSYSLSSVLTGAVFFLMGKCRLGALIGFFPRHILIGCIGGVGWFLVATGLEVSARLDGSLDYNLATLQKLFQADTVALWTIPLALAITLLILKRSVTHPLTDATFFLSVIAIFYFFVLAIPNLKLEELRATGWVFEAPEAGVPFYHFYSLYGKFFYS